jgi:hypothetical protein
MDLKTNDFFGLLKLGFGSPKSMFDHITAYPICYMTVPFQIYFFLFILYEIVGLEEIKYP